MKQNLITDVIQGMLPYLNNAQTERLQLSKLKPVDVTLEAFKNRQ